MTFRQFHNALRILLNIDKPEFVETIDPEDVEYFGSKNPRWVDTEWANFRANPHRYFIQCGDSQAQKLFAIIEQRNRGII